MPARLDCQRVGPIGRAEDGETGDPDKTPSGEAVSIPARRRVFSRAQNSVRTRRRTPEDARGASPISQRMRPTSKWERREQRRSRVSGFREERRTAARRAGDRPLSSRWICISSIAFGIFPTWDARFFIGSGQTSVAIRPAGREHLRARRFRLFLKGMDRPL